ncbi:glutathione S-transferase [Ephemerocybe angulata]|uniref:glutathione transferase n=1 Tax=Ephemerocybe angulata TaxID=980116 RepID=A0A8H6IIH6_9AGAR|nr:glutathione S-transferase [Tulosesus angulatus]
MAETDEHSPTLVLHYLENSRSHRILWLLEELGVPYTLKVYKRTAVGLAPPELHKVHPLGKAPVLTDGPLMLAETAFIVEYLISKYGKEKFRISDESSQAWRDNVFYTHYAEGSVQPPIIRRYVNNKFVNHVPIFLRPVARVLFNKFDVATIAPDLEKHGKLIESHLEVVESKGGWFAGTGEDKPTSADFMMSFTLETFLKVAPEFVGPKTKEYVKRLEARPAYQRATEKAGGYLFLYKE